MQLRRVLLILLVVMVTSAFAASLVRSLSVRQPQTPQATTTAPAEGGPSAPDSEATEQKSPAFAADDAELLELTAGRDPEAVFEPGTHLVVSVSSREPGQAFIVGLGQLIPVNPGTPAIFDLLLDREGEFPVRVRPVDGTDDLPAGVIRVEEEAVRGRRERPRA